ncbi:MAG: alpha/beta fold hydrolase [Gammaproteobacteria bacterium]|nr:alpha/beta fold hydrolase [Gammaproteobacteria bacterium]
MNGRACATFLLLLPLQSAGGQSACEDWNTPAFFQSASLETLQRCLAAGADPASPDEDGWAPLHHAAQFADALDVFAMLVAAGADPDAVGDDVASPLSIAAGNDRPAQVIAALAEAGADPNAADDDGWTAFHYAASQADSSHVVAALAAAGADPNAADDSGWTPLHVATRDNSPAMVRALVEVGADPRRRTSHGWPALTTATMWGSAPGVAGEILRLHLPDGSLTDDLQWTRTGLHQVACWFEHERAWPPKACYYFVVNENPDDGASPLVGFPVVRFRARGAAPQDNPILHLGAGGPGRAMDFDRDPYWIWSTYRALAQGSGRDLYVIDPRGTGMSYPRLHCRHDVDRLREGLSKRLPAREDAMVRSTAYRACKTRLDTEGRNLENYNSGTIAADVEALRRALGVKQWVLLGHSYAARYALTVGRDFPVSVEAMVLAAAAFPGLPGAETHAGDMHRALERAFDHCSRIGVCDADSLRPRFWELVRRFDEDPLVLTGLEILSYHYVERLELTGARLLRAVFAALYDPEFFEVFPFLVQQLEYGRTSILERHVLRIWFHTLLDETYSAPVRAGHYCAEEEPFVDSEAAARDARTANVHIRRLAEIGFEPE